MTIIWLIAYLVENTPDLFNGTGNDTAWLLVLGICLALDLLGGRSAL